MDRINGAGHVGRRFVAENADLGRPPTLITDAWLNSVQEEIVNVILGSGGTLDGEQEDQLLQAINNLIQAASEAFVSVGGTADAITATYTPVIAALTNGLTVYVRAASANATSTPTFTPASGVIAAKAIVKGAGDALVAGDIAGAGHWIELQFDQTLDKWVLQNPATGVSVSVATSIQGAFKNLQASSTGLSANVSVTADEIAVENAANEYKTLRGVNLTIAVNGGPGAANGLDAGALATSTWYSVWVIWNGVTTAGLLSLSATAPTLPAGYTHKARVGWIRTDASGNKYPLPFKQAGRRVQYVVAAGSNLTAMPQMAAGTAGNVSTPTWVAVAVGAFVPSTASIVSVAAVCPGTSTQATVAPNNSYGASNSTTNPPPLNVNCNLVTGLVGSAEILLESTNIYWASANSNLHCRGWEDNI